MHISPIEYDFIGIGFGPSNLAIAVAIEEQTRFGGAGISHCYIEKKPAFVWHGSMLLEGSDMQISFLKDLATLRDPTSKFTFINYLHTKGRLRDFINLKSFFPSRIEYNDYLRWAAGHFDLRCRYGEEVIEIEPVKEGAKIARLKVHSVDVSGRTHTRQTRNLVFGIGGVPNIPAVFDHALRLPDARVFHAAHYLEKMASLVQTKGVPRRIAVIGGGQSGAEIFMDLVNRFDTAEVTLITRGEALMPSDDSPFVNEIFSPQFTDLIYGQPQAQRRATLEKFRSTNYAVVDLDLIEKIYMLLYQQQVSGVKRHAVLAAKEVTAVHLKSDAIALRLRDAHSEDDAETAGFDAVVLATGYRRDDHKRLLGGIADYIDGYDVERDYCLRTTPDFLPNIYLQGCCEESHGLSDTLLSVLAVRSVDILESLFDKHRQRSDNSCPIEAVKPSGQPSLHAAV
ncbi:lysine N(6)-hydroxylase/L-ornithine N(5)-oxygenase family protein [Glaciimonas sp. GG7]